MRNQPIGQQVLVYRPPLEILVVHSLLWFGLLLAGLFFLTGLGERSGKVDPQTIPIACFLLAVGLPGSIYSAMRISRAVKTKVTFGNLGVTWKSEGREITLQYTDVEAIKIKRTEWYDGPAYRVTDEQFQLIPKPSLSLPELSIFRKFKEGGDSDDGITTQALDHVAQFVASLVANRMLQQIQREPIVIAPRLSLSKDGLLIGKPDQQKLVEWARISRIDLDTEFLNGIGEKELEIYAEDPDRSVATIKGGIPNFLPISRVITQLHASHHAQPETKPADV